MLKKILFLLSGLLIFLFSNISFVNAAEIYKHVQADGTSIVFLQDVRRIRDGIFFDDLSIEIHKIFKENEKNYSAIRIMTDGAVASKYDIASVNFVIDGKAHELVPLIDARKDDLPEAVEQIWYQFPEELADNLRNAKKLVVYVQLSNGKKDQTVIEGKELQKFKFISEVNDANIGSEQARQYGHTESFKMFFPGIKPEEIGTGLLYKANYQFGKFNYYNDYYRAYFRPDWTKFSFEYIKNYIDRSSYPFILADMREENNGTTIKLDVLGKYYRQSSPPSYYQIDPKGKINKYELWELDVWADRLMALYQDLHGSYNYGIEWEISNTEKNVWKRIRDEWSAGPYNISRINKERYKELQDVNIGDKIIAINGKPTDMMYYPQSVVETKYSGAPVEFTIGQADGSVKKIKITPDFIPSTTPRVKYLELIKKNSGQLKGDVEFIGSYDAVFITYDPLGKREF